MHCSKQVSLVIRSKYAPSFCTTNLKFADKKSIFDLKNVILDHYIVLRYLVACIISSLEGSRSNTRMDNPVKLRKQISGKTRTRLRKSQKK